MKTKTIVIAYFTINIAMIIGVLIVDGPSAKSSAMTWGLFVIGLFLLGCIIQVISNYKKS